MKKFSGYSDVKENNFDREKLKLGAHICKIIDVNEITINAKDPKNNFNQLVIQFDIAAPDEQEGFYSRRYKEDAAKDAMKAKWKGIYKLSVPKDDGSENDEKSKVNFKTFITSVEKSNEGYDWEKSDWDEKSLKGKLFGGVFGIREFENTMTGETNFMVECRFVRSIEYVNKEFEKEERYIPKVSCVDKTLIDYSEWIEKRKAEREGNNVTNNENSDLKPIAEDDDLPF